MRRKAEGIRLDAGGKEAIGSPTILDTLSGILYKEVKIDIISCG